MLLYLLIQTILWKSFLGNYTVPSEAEVYLLKNADIAKLVRVEDENSLN